VATVVFSMLLILEPGAAGRPALTPASGPPTIDWPDFFASVTSRGLVYSDRLQQLEGKRVRIRGFSVVREGAEGGVLLTRIPYVESDPHGPDAEFDIPYDAVGVVWRKGVRLPRVPERPTIEGTLQLGNRTVGTQRVAVLLVDAVPVFSAKPR
jgi:hypothetical protein